MRRYRVGKPSIRSAVFGLLRFSGLPFLLRELWQRNRVSIVTYHELTAARADAHFSVLRARYNIISLSQFLAARSRQTVDRLPRKAMIVTFDDGYKSNYGLTSVIAKHRIPVTVFLCSGIVATRRHYWWQHTTGAGEAQALKTLPDNQRVETLLRRGHTDTREYETRESLSRDEIRVMKSVVDFQSHTVFHPILPVCSRERARREIVVSKETLERDHGLKIYALAYPNGDYSDREIRLLQQTGYSCGLTLDAGSNDFQTDPFRLRRVALPNDAGINEVIVKASGLWEILKALTSRSTHVRYHTSGDGR